MSVATLSLLFVACFFVTLLAGLPLAFSTGAVAVFFAYFLFGSEWKIVIEYFAGSNRPMR